MSINGSLSLNDMAMNIFRGDKYFILYLREKEKNGFDNAYEEVLINPINDEDFEGINLSSPMRNTYVYFKNNFITLGELYDKYMNRGHFFDSYNYLEEYSVHRRNL